MKCFRHSLLIGTLVALAGVVFAQPPMPAGRGAMPFSFFDQNRDGSISQKEFIEGHTRLPQRPNPPGYSVRRYYDSPKFSDFDQNSDGTLTPEEFAQGQTNRRLQRQQQMWGSGEESGAPINPGMGRGMGPGGGPGMGRGRGLNMPAFGEFDLNDDGVLQRQEFEQARAQRIRQRAEQGYMMRNLQNAPPFDSIDGNGDGVVSAEEFAAAQALHRQP